MIVLGNVKRFRIVFGLHHRMILAFEDWSFWLGLCFDLSRFVGGWE